MNTYRPHVFSCFLLLGSLILLLLAACVSPGSKESFSPKYALYLLNEDGSNSFYLKDSLQDQGKTQEISVPNADFTREYIQKDGNFYHVNERTDYLVHYQLNNLNKLTAVDSIQLKDGYLENYLWKSASDTLLLFTVEKKTTDKSRMYVLDTKNFKLIREQLLPLPAAIADFDLLNIGVVDIVSDRLWIAYSYSKYLEDKDYTTSDTMYYATLDYATLEVLDLQKDTRSSYPGGLNTVQSYSGRDENGDFYFMSCPGIALGNNQSQPTAIFRKKNGQVRVDTDYILNISKAINNHAYGFWYIGGHKAIIRSEQKDKYTDFSNHHSTYQFEYYVVDLISQRLQKLDLPLDKGTRKENVLIQGDNVYFGIDSEDQQHQIWAYSISQDRLSSISSVTKSVDYILRLDFLK